MCRRENGIDFLRCFSFFLVIIFHSFLQNGYTTYPQNGTAMYFAGVVRWLSVSCIGLYLLQTGYLHYGKKITPSYFYPLIRVYIGYVLVSIISIPVRQFLLNDNQTAVEWGRRFFAFSACNYGWYVFMYMGLILLSPLVNLTADNINSGKLLIFVVVTFTLCTSLPGLTSHNVMPDYWMKAYPLSYYMLGVLIKKYKPRIKKSILILVITVLIFVLSAITIRSTDKNFSSAVKWEFGALPIVVLSAALFLLFYDINTGERAARLCRWIGTSSLEGYLISHLFDAWVYKQIPQLRIPEYYPLTFICITVPVFMICAFAGHYLNKLSVFIYMGITKHLGSGLR